MTDDIEEAKPWTDEDIETMFRLFNEGRSIAEVAKIMDRGRPSVRNARFRYGNRKPEWRVVFQAKRTRWTAEERRILAENEHKTDAQLTELLPFRCESAIADMRKRIRMRLKAERSAKFAQPIVVTKDETETLIKVGEPFDTPYGVKAVRRPGPVGSPPITLVYLPSVYA